MIRERLEAIYRNVVFRAIALSFILSLAYIFFLSKLPPVKIGSLKTYDALFLLKHKLKGPEDVLDETVVVGIDDVSYRKMNLRWPWPRRVMAGAVEKISSAEPKVICFDFVIGGESTEKDDLALAKALEDAGNVYLASFFAEDRIYVIPEDFAVKTSRGCGFVDKPRDEDSAVRRTRPFMLSTKGDIIDYSLVSKTAAYYLGMPVENLVNKAPLLQDGTAYIYFFGARNDIPYISAYELFEDSFDTRRIKGKMAFFGVTSEFFHDIYRTPFGRIPGVFVMLNEALTFTEHKFFRRIGEKAYFAVLFLFIFVSIACSLKLSIGRGLALSAGVVFLAFVFGFTLFYKGIIIDTFGLIIMAALTSIFIYLTKYVVLLVENAVLKRESITDGLTGTYVHRYFELRLKFELKKAAAGKKPLSLLLIDLDNFKSVNDTYGHEFGNVALKRVAEVMKKGSRRYDTVARYGGEEFCIIMPNTTLDRAFDVAERIRKTVSKINFKVTQSKMANITISGGVASTESCPADNHKNLIESSDRALYRAKLSGRNRIIVFKDKEVGT